MGRTPTTVLVADDDPDILKLISRRLAHRGYEVLTATNGQDALDVALVNRPDLVVLDGIMPGLEGHEVCAMMRASSETARIPVVLLTAKAADADLREASSAGADAFIVKPFRMAELDEKLQELLGASGHRR